LSRRSALLRPAPTAYRPPTHFPGSPVIGRHRFPPPRRRRAEEALPSSQDDHPRVQRPIRRRVLQRSWIPGAFHGPCRRLNGSAPSWPTQTAGSLDDACSGFTHVADRTVASAPLRTRPLDHARGHNYRGPRRLPRPDSHRQAALNLSLGLRHDDLPLFMAPEQSGRSRRKQQCASCGPQLQYTDANLS
jgi:hypothetical protein